MVPDETNAPTRGTNLDVLIRFLASESAAIAQQIHEANCNATINVENKSILLGSCHLHGKSIVKETKAQEVLPYILLDELDTQIRVIHALYLVSDTADEFVRLSRLVNELSRSKPSITNMTAASSRAPPNR